MSSKEIMPPALLFAAFCHQNKSAWVSRASDSQSWVFSRHGASHSRIWCEEKRFMQNSFSAAASFIQNAFTRRRCALGACPGLALQQAYRPVGGAARLPSCPTACLDPCWCSFSRTAAAADHRRACKRGLMQSTHFLTEKNYTRVFMIFFCDFAFDTIYCPVNAVKELLGLMSGRHRVRSPAAFSPQV
jgi:hypothetical protein